MAKEINDYLTIADDSDILKFTSAEKPRSLDHSSKDLIGTVDGEVNEGIQDDPEHSDPTPDPPTGPALPDPDPPVQDDGHTEIG